MFGDFEHHLQISVGDYIPNSWVMFNWDIYQPLYYSATEVALHHLRSVVTPWLLRAEAIATVQDAVDADAARVWSQLRPARCNNILWCSLLGQVSL